MIARLRLLVALLLVGSLVGCSKVPRINGGGSSFVYPLMLQWSRSYERFCGVQVDYQATGSGNGVQQTIARTIHFGCTDAFIKDDLLAKARQKHSDMIHIPLALGAVVPIYNVPEAGKEGMRFSGTVLADMYLGKIRYWDDPAIVALNPEKKLPHREIVVVSRADGSGTTAIFTDYLSKVSAEWKKQVGSGTTVSWPKEASNVGQRGNEGVAGQVSRAPYSLGYVELIYATQNKLEYGSVETRDSAEKNAAHRAKSNSDLPIEQRVFLRASAENVTSAADAMLSKIPDDLRYSLTNTVGPNSYPISGSVWAVLYVRQPNDIGPTLVEFLRWAIRAGGEGQDLARRMGYAPLPASLSERAQRRLDLVTFE